MTETIVSVIIPTYKPKAHLWNCIDSICHHTLALQLYDALLQIFKVLSHKLSQRLG